MEIGRNVVRWGNGGGVLVPREWINKEVKVVLIDRTLEIKKEIFDILGSYLHDIIGIYLTGSYARGEETKESDIDIIAISKDIRKEIISGKYHISIATLESIKLTLKKDPILIYPRLKEAKTILNESLLKELLDFKITKESFKEFIEGCKRIIKINKKFIELDKIDSEYLESVNSIYSIILRLRGVFIMKLMLENKQYSNKLFKTWLTKNIAKEEFEKIYQAYQDLKEDKKPKIKIELWKIEKLLDLLEKEVKKYG